MSGVVCRLHIRGRVQGVGYRWAMVSEAERLAVRGWVRNRRDGSVEAMVEGDAASVERLIDWAHRGPRGARVTAVDVYPAEPGSFTAFEQRPDG
jgi:acylphosphatase